MKSPIKLLFAVITFGILHSLAFASGNSEYIDSISTDSIPSEPANPALSYAQTLWQGNWELDGTTNSYFRLDSMQVADLKAGDILRCFYTYSQSKPGYWIDFCYGKYNSSLPDASNNTLIKRSVMWLTLTDRMLDKIKTNGITICGKNVNLIEVDICDGVRRTNATLVTDDEIKLHFDSEETPSLTFALQAADSVAGLAELVLTLRDDMYNSYDTHAVIDTAVWVNPDSLSHVTFDMHLQPGIYNYSLYINGKAMQTYNIGYNLRGILHETDVPADFEDFWNDAMTQLASIQPEYNLVKLEQLSTPLRNVYMVEMKSVPDSASGSEPVIIRGYMAEPVAPGRYPVVMEYPGYDSNVNVTPNPTTPSANKYPERIDFFVSIRGQSANNRGDYREQNAYYGDWFTYGLSHRDSYYYRGAYMDALRAFDFICSRDRTDTDNIFAQGSSQGGMLTYATAGLIGLRSKLHHEHIHHFNSLSTNVAAFGDYPCHLNMPLGFSNMVKEWMKKNPGVSQGNVFETLAYFDTKYLAQYISSPVLASIGLQDQVCPPHSNLAPYNVIANKPDAKTQLTVYPYMTHSVPANWLADSWAFFLENLITTATVEPVETDSLGLNFTVVGNTLQFNNEPNEAYTIYNPLGQTVYHGHRTAVTLPATGIYLLHYRNHTTRIPVL